MGVTIEQILEMYARGTATVLHGGKMYFRKEKGYRCRKPTAR